MGFQRMHASLFGALLLFLSHFSDALISPRTGSSCKNIPGDGNWPSSRDWAALNDTLSGRLIKTVPQAHICHLEPYEGYNETSCQALRNAWNSPQTFELLPAEMINPVPQNQSCDPYTAKEKPCTLDNYPVYSINVTGAADVVTGIQFARNHNIRLSIKNTGHDYQGKSSGLGSLSLWMHNLQALEVINQYSAATTGNWSYNGPAARLGAGIIGGQAYETLGSQGYRIVGGSCPSVGLAGGYTPGGGHSLLNTKYGMAADNVLEWEVITAGGDHLFATPNNNSDLYWALSGGGPGTFAVVLSMTTKIYPEGPVGAGTLSFNSSAVGNETYWQAIGTWFEHLPSMVLGGNTFDLIMTAETFSIFSITLPDQESSDVEKALGPYLNAIEDLGIDYTFQARTDPSYLQHFNTDFGPLPYGGSPVNTLFHSRLIPRAVVEDAKARENVMKAYQNTLATGFLFVGCHGFSVQNATRPANAVLPAWRDAVAICNFVGDWEWDVPRSVMNGRKQELVDIHVPAIEEATPNSGTYLNEVDSLYYLHGDWKGGFYGANYQRLTDIKNKYDPEHIFYAVTAIGSDFWYQDSEGRLCERADNTQHI